MCAACIDSWLLTRSDKKRFEALERNHSGDWMMLEFAVMQKVEAGSWQQQRICGWFREFGWMEGVVGRWNRALLNLYAFWQMQFQECVNDSYVWSSFHFIPYTHHYIQHIKFQVWNWSTSHYVGALFENISFTDTLNRATFIEKQLHISVVYDHHWAISTVF